MILLLLTQEIKKTFTSHHLGDLEEIQWEKLICNHNLTDKCRMLDHCIGRERTLIWKYINLHLKESNGGN